MHICVGLVGISYDEMYNHRKIDEPIIINGAMLYHNHKKFIFDDLDVKGHRYDVVISTNVHEHVEEYASLYNAVHLDTNCSSLHEREHHVLEYCLKNDYDACFIIRCDLVFHAYFSFMNVNACKMNFPFHQVIYERWKQLRFKRVPAFNKREVGGGMYFIPKRLFGTAKDAFHDIIRDDKIHKLCDYFNPTDVHFISNRRYQSNTDVMRNPLFQFQRSSKESLNPNMKNPRYVESFIGAYQSTHNLHPDFERCVKILRRYV